MSSETRGRGKIYSSIIDTIGDTPIVRLDKLAKAHGVKANLMGKLEFFNPIASVKDRIGVAMIERDFSNIGTVLDLETPNGLVKAIVCDLPMKQDPDNYTATPTA